MLAAPTQKRLVSNMSKLGNLGARLYRGELSYDFVGRRRLLYTISAALLGLSLVGLFGRGLNLGIEFRGGAEFQVAAASGTVEQARASAPASKPKADDVPWEPEAEDDDMSYFSKLADD